VILPALREVLSEARLGFGLEPIAMNLRASPFEGQGPNFPLATLDKFSDFVMGFGDGEAAVTPQSAMRLTAVWACINVISGSLAMIPLITYRRREDGGKDRARDHYLYRRLRWQANRYMTAFRFKRLMQVWLLQHGNALAYLEINGRGQVVNMWPWHPDRVEMEIKGGDIWYSYRMDDGKEIWQPWFNILHLRGMETDGFWGLSPIATHRKTISHQLSIREHGAKFFENGARPLGWLEYPEALDDQALQRLRQDWQQTHGGLSNAHKTAILEQGLKYHPEGISMVDAQYIESQQFGIADIARIYNVPPHKIQDLLRSTNNNIEWQGLEWLVDTLGPWFTCWEEELTASVLSEREAELIEIEFLRDAIMRADARARADYYSKALQHHWMVPNEVRQRENQNPIKGGDEMLETNNAAMPGKEEKEDSN